MNLDKIKEFIQLAKDENVKTLKYEKDDMKLEVSLPFSDSVMHTQMSAPAMQQGQTQEASSPVVDSNLQEIKSPFVGTFYRSPAPDEPAFVKIGDSVSTGQTLCILEAMKIMNEIDSEVSGRVVEICVENESLVEFGQVLFRIRK